MRAALAALFYGATSVSATVATKAVMSGWGFRHIPFLMVVERILMAASLFASGAAPLATAHRACRRLWPLAVVSLLNTFVAVSSLEGLNLPMYNALKRLTSLVTIAMEAIVLGKFSSYQVQASVAMIAMGAVVAAQHDLDFDLPSYVWALGSCCMNALYLTLVKRECNRHVHGDVVSEISLVNNLVPIPLLLVYLELSGERARAFDFEAWLNPVFWCVLLASTAAGCLLGFAQCLCTKHSSALTTTVVGQMKMLLSTYLGILVFGTKITSLQAVGLAINTAGGCLFAYLKHVESKKPSLPASTAEQLPAPAAKKDS